LKQALQLLRKMLVSLVSIYLLVGAILYLLQRDYLYYPTAEIAHPYKTEAVSSGAENLEIIVLNPDQEKAIIYFGGNAETVVVNGPDFASGFEGYSVYLMNYRGYSKSTGTPSEDALYGDALALYEAIATKHSSFAVIGRSLGSGVATWLAAQRPVEKLILVTPFDSILHIAADRYPVYPVEWMLKDHFDSLSRVAGISASTLVIKAEHDRVIPGKYTDILYQGFAAGQAQLETLQGVGHNNLSDHPRYLPLLREFISTAPGK